MSVRTATTLLTGLFLVSVLGGCGDDPTKPKLGKVHGKVTLDGKPVERGHIVFTPVSGKGGETGQTATGEINSDGTFDLTTFDTGDGAILGQHIATVTVPEPGSENLGKPDASGRINYVLPKNTSPKKYEKADTSPLRYTVKEGSNAFEIELKQ
jgi:hypothetical protein